MKFLAHISTLTVAFLTIFVSLVLAAACIVAALSFVFWTIPAVPPSEVIFLTIRVLILISLIVTGAYAFSADYKQSIHEYLSS